MRLLLTAGFGRSAAALALATLLRREGLQVAGVLVASPFRPARLRALVRQRGLRAVPDSVRRLAGAAGSPRAPVGPLRRFCDEQAVTARSLSGWCRESGAAIRSVASLNDQRALRFVETVSPDGAVYCGGGILRAGFLEALRGRVLNAHAGPLPEVRGMNACEWSLLLGLEPTVTIHFIDRGIDTGPAVARIPVPLQPGDDLETLRERAQVVGIQGLVRHVGALAQPPPPSERASGERQCFVLAPALRELAQLELRRRLGRLW